MAAASTVSPVPGSVCAGFAGSCFFSVKSYFCRRPVSWVLLAFVISASASLRQSVIKELTCPAVSLPTSVFASSSSKDAIDYVVENEYHAEVSKNGLVTARFVGETNVLLSNGEDTKNFKVIVAPKSNLYPEPDVKFGDSKSSIVAKFGTPDAETSSGIVYTDYSNAAPILMFLFDSNKLSSYAVMVRSSYSSALDDFLLERYLVGSESDGLYLFINGLNTTTATMAIGLQLYDISYWMVTYFPYTSARSASLKSGENRIDTSASDELLKQLP